MSTVPATGRLGAGSRVRAVLGDRVLLGVTALAALITIALMVLITYRILRGAHLAVSSFGLSFLWHTVWDNNKGIFGAGTLLYGTAVTSAMALLIAGPLGIAIALFLTELAPPGVKGIVVSLVEMLAAVPSVVLGLWGILVLGPFMANHVEPWLHDTLGFIPLFKIGRAHV